MIRKKRWKYGYTLVELIIVLVILAVMASIVIPTFTGFIEKTKEERYVLEAQGVRRSIELYMIENYYEEVDSMVLMFELTSCTLDSPKNPLADYLTVKCSKGAYLEGLTIDGATLSVIGIVYHAAGYRVEIDSGSISVTRDREK